MTEADAEDGTFLRHHAPHVLDRLDAHLGVAGAVGDHHTVESLLHEVVVPGDADHRDAATHEAPDDAVLAATVDHHDSRRAISVNYGILGAHTRNEVLPVGVAQLDVLPVHDLAEHHAV